MCKNPPQSFFYPFFVLRANVYFIIISNWNLSTFQIKHAETADYTYSLKLSVKKWYLSSALTFTPHIALIFLFPARACEWTLPHPSLYCVRWSNEPWYDWLSSKRSMFRLAIAAVTRMRLVTFSLHVSPEYRAHWGTTGIKTGDARFVIVLLFFFTCLCACQ